ncbi:PTS sugar transporter subunit IIC [Halapricum sp. CBA1109]|uniref:PTS fructose transporter subunit IIB n=1 Tax=Halapricum sp. CBA1109 TaxID=2668068 RepID=UPI0012F80DE6|nr:PTS fructose transporter subunit IIB [Halapricum sp. CBA1109]MUV90797.1 PTS sugar transporter subunit IIC [Halapricum sp. CBA1109]
MKFVAVTACPTGIAHSQMGAEGLEQAGEATGHDVRVEIQGAMGAEDELTEAEIAEADAVIIAADTSVSRDRFEGKPLVKAPVARAINEAEELLEEAAAAAENADSGDDTAEAVEADASSASASTGGTEPADSSREREEGATADSGGLLSKIKGLFS